MAAGLLFSACGKKLIMQVCIELPGAGERTLRVDPVNDLPDFQNAGLGGDRTSIHNMQNLCSIFGSRKNPSKMKPNLKLKRVKCEV